MRASILNQISNTRSKRSGKPTTALRLVSTKNMDREDWLKQRLQGVGASEAATAVGLNPYQSPLELWMIKTGRMEQAAEPAIDESHSPMYWGNMLEPLVAEHYAKVTGRKVRRVNSILQHPDADKYFMLANLDREVVGCDEVQILECKTAGKFGSKVWEDGVPEYYQCQVQHQLAITGKQAADVAVLIAGNEFRIYRVERDDELITQLIELERQFWHYVETDTPPPVDGSGSASRALQNLFPQDTGEAFDFTEDSELNQVFDELKCVREQSSDLAEREALLKQRIQQALGEASKAVFINGSVSWKKAADSQTLDTKSLLKEQPDLIEKYPSVRKGARRFLVA